MILFFLIMTNAYISNQRITMSTQEFNSEVNCLQALNKLIEMESKSQIRVKAFCVKK
jgi:hypothetical protein